MDKPRRKVARRRPQPSTPAPSPTEVFSADSPDRAFMPAADMFGPTVGLNTARRALFVRAGFMEALLGDPRVVRLLVGWLERVAADPKAFTTDDVLPLVTAELGLRWPWCVVDILDTFNRMVQLKIADPVKAMPPMEADVLAPPLVVWFTTEEGEAIDEMRERWKALNAAMMGELDTAQATAAGGYAPKGDAHLRSWGRKFYEARIKKPVRSITALAREYHLAAGHSEDFADSDCRVDIRRMIREAERLLNLGEYVFRAPGGKAPMLDRK